jgi:hypothetical protein
VAARVAASAAALAGNTGRARALPGGWDAAGPIGRTFFRTCRRSTAPVSAGGGRKLQAPRRQDAGLGPLGYLCGGSDQPFPIPRASCGASPPRRGPSAAQEWQRCLADREVPAEWVSAPHSSVARQRLDGPRIRPGSMKIRGPGRARTTAGAASLSPPSACKTAQWRWSYPLTTRCRGEEPPGQGASASQVIRAAAGDDTRGRGGAPNQGEGITSEVC